MTSNSRHLDTIVIGGGPIGIETAIELQQRGLNVSVIEGGSIGNTISWWAPQTRWFSSNDRIAIAGVPLSTIDQSKASREEYLNYLRSVVDQFQVQIQTYQRVVQIEPVDAPGSPGRWRVGTVGNHPGTNNASGAASGDPTTQNAEVVSKQPLVRWTTANSIVLATGGTDVPNQLNVPGESLPHVDGYLREVHRYHGRHVLIVGGRNSAVEAAIRLYRGGAHVSLCYHRSSLPEDGIKYWLRPEMEGLIRSGSIQVFFDSRVVQIGEDSVSLVTQRPGEEDTKTEVAVDDVLTLIGYRQDQTLFEQLEILSKDEAPKPLYNETTMETPRAGIYVAGTAIGGTQSSRYQVFLENCHQHVAKIADHIAGSGAERNQSKQQPPKTASKHLDYRIQLQPES
ncbi:thioredoxin reductase (NADPH) [Neorhodopirellula lusitana]|uniref:Thioredoxin reductase (NADPH) n=1 Tax=Neorhodopirellula lusitana TaxID=445327 RepID=A0ABY1QKN8_9BACT|nr:NAD(P)-binding domain-containing protein [Neorhodopirellula lusitana]SMP73895.1 thioredoxin reductase (NADPH) [Neorhodopirellula lusitana]